MGNKFIKLIDIIDNINKIKLIDIIDCLNKKGVAQIAADQFCLKVGTHYKPITFTAFVVFLLPRV